MAKVTHRLNRKYSKGYALFIVDEETDTVEFSQFMFPTGPIVKEKTLTLAEGRKLYQEMVASRVQFLPHDARQVNEWVAKA